MYCRNCGERYVTDQAVLCVKCGVPKGTGAYFCPNCGNATQPGYAVCLNCGVSLVQQANPEQKSQLVAGILGILFGSFGVHNFYLGYTSKAIAQLLLTILGLILSCVIIGVFVCMGTSIWGFVEGVMILCGNINCDGQGRPLKKDV